MRLMKYVFYALLLQAAGCSKGKNKTSSQEPPVFDSAWKKQKVNEVLSVSLPDSINSTENEVMRGFFANGRLGLYGIDYYDTVIVAVSGEKDFRNAIKGFMYGKLKDPLLSNYNLTIRDTSIAGTSGYFLTGYTNDSLQSCKYASCYLTMAQNEFYWFYTCRDTPEINNEVRQFFYSIKFDTDKIPESSYTLERERIHRKADDDNDN